MDERQYADLGVNPAIITVWSEFTDATRFPTASSAINRLFVAPLGSFSSLQYFGHAMGGSGGVECRGGGRSSERPVASLGKYKQFPIVLDLRYRIPLI